MKITLITLLIPLSAVHAGPRTSASYSMPAETVDAAGRRSASASYTNDGSAGGIAGLSTVTAPAETAKHGYIGQLYDVTGLTLTAPQLTLNEAATLQLSAWQSLDDLSLLSVPAASVSWSVQSGPLSSISAGGLATAGNVYQNTSAVARGAYAGNTGALDLTVLNAGSDDFGLYAGDGIIDLWQVQYFGENNPNAAPGADADRDGQDNLFEFRAGYVPTDPASLLTITSAGNDGTAQALELSRVQPGTRYLFQRSADLTTWLDEISLVPAAVSTPFTQALPASGARNFYRVRLLAP